MRAGVLSLALVLALGVGQEAPTPTAPSGARPDVFSLYQQGAHTGSAAQAIVGIEVASASADGSVTQVRRGNGVVLRCDGFVLVPLGLLNTQITVAGQVEQATRQGITVVLHPGTPRERRVTASAPRFVAQGVPYTVLKLDGVHAPALPALLPDTLKPGDTALVTWAPWSPKDRRFGAPAQRTVHLAEAADRQVAAPAGQPGPSAPAAAGVVPDAGGRSGDPPPVVPPDGGAASRRVPGTRSPQPPAAPGPSPSPSPSPPAPSRTLVAVSRDDGVFTETLEDVPAGAVVSGPSSMGIGLVSGSGTADRCHSFATFGMLERITNCVTALAAVEVTSAAEAAPMVAVPGGAVVLPASVLAGQPDMGGASVACVAPFEIDKYEVTNRQYLVFWQSLPADKKEFLGYRNGRYPMGWAPTGAPFPAGLADAPVLGVPLPGARDYARWCGKRLPTPYEWCLAAFGPDGPGAMPDWARQYVSERNHVWDQLVDLHLDYLAQNPGLKQAPTMLQTSTLPWIAYSAAAALPAAWSRDHILQALEPLWAAWKEPPYILPVGSRPFDVSPFGAADMILNAAEQVAPYPGPPVRGSLRAVSVEWMKAPWRTPEKELRVLDVPWPVMTDDHPLQPLSRLYRRNAAGPTVDYLTAVSALDEVRQMESPLRGWTVRVDGALTSTASMLPKPFRWSGPWPPASYDAWRGLPAHYRAEMGRPVPLDSPETHVSTEPPLHYVLPVGFRCAR